MVAPTATLAAKNNARSATAGTIDGVTDPVTFSVTAGQGALFPQPTTDGPFMITIDNEILKVTTRSTDSFTAVRAQEGTSIASHASGAAVEARVTAKQVSDLQTILRGMGRAQLGPSGSLMPENNAATPAILATGILNPITRAGAGTPTRELDDDGLSVTDVSTAGSGDNAGWSTDGMVTRPDLSPVFACRLGLATITSIRGFAGISDQTLDTMVSADSPAGDYAGISFNVGLNANWRFIRKDNASGTPTYNDSAIAIAADTPVFFLMEVAAASITFSLYTAAYGLSIATTVTTLLPTSTDSMRVIVALETTTTAARSISVYSAFLANHAGRITVL